MNVLNESTPGQLFQIICIIFYYSRFKLSKSVEH
jgi:hypothetical protein